MRSNMATSYKKDVAAEHLATESRQTMGCGGTQDIKPVVENGIG
jgi:hypothetical protein